MGIWERIRNLWLLSAKLPEEAVEILQRPQRQKAEFIMPNRTTEILKEKPDASLQDVIE